MKRPDDRGNKSPSRRPKTRRTRERKRPTDRNGAPMDLHHLPPAEATKPAEDAADAPPKPTRDAAGGP